ncbi:hypothetical protein IKD60_00880 [Candidatus Saccharibacteria bacterium]|nr:hypothetical protein [Candidatus Saccharibacteria bacterium]
MYKKLIAAAIAITGITAPLANINNVYAEDGLTTSTPQVTSSDASNVATGSWIQVSPVSSRVILKPNTALDYSMIVSNIGNSEFKFSTYVAPYSVVDEDYNVSFSNESNRTQLSRWIKFINDDGSLSDTYTGTIPAGEKKTVNYRISVPEDVPSGGQYAAIFAQTEADNTAVANTTGITTVSRIGLVVYGRTEGETDEKAEITDFHMDRFLNKGPVKASALVKNSGNTDFEAKFEYTVSSVFGNELYRKEDAQNVLPDTSRRRNYEWENTSAMGIFKATFKVTALNEVKEETHLIIIMPIYMIVIGIILLTILTVWIIILIRKRRERKSKFVA